MEKPITKDYSPESYDKLLAYARYLSGQLVIKKDELQGDALKKAKMDAMFAWRDVHEMAISVSKNFASNAGNALNEILDISIRS